LQQSLSLIFGQAKSVLEELTNDSVGQVALEFEPTSLEDQHVVRLGHGSCCSEQLRLAHPGRSLQDDEVPRPTGGLLEKS
jgi:hypothetical protein